MAGIVIQAELHDEEAQAALQALLDRMANRRPFFAIVSERLLTSADDRFRTETDPDGTPWVSLRPATIAARKRNGQVPIAMLQATKGPQSLKGSLHAVESEDEVQIGSPLAHAAIHQFGGTIEKKSGSRYMVGRRFAKRDQEGGRDVAIKAHSITIPARQYLGLTKGDEEGILEDAEDWLMR